MLTEISATDDTDGFFICMGKVKLYKDAGRINEETLLIVVAKFSTVNRSVENGNIFFAVQVTFVSGSLVCFAEI